MYYVDKTIQHLNRIFDQNSRMEYLRLDLNENPGGLPAEFVQNVAAELSPQLVAQYPETLPFTEALARYLNTDISHLCLTNGSSEAIRYIIQAYTSVNGKILCVSPSYAMFRIYAEMYGRDFISIPYNRNLEMPIENILKAMNPDIQLLILVNPNNPVGNTYTIAEFEEILAEAEKNHITVLVDEAYFYFYPESFIDYALNRRHIFITRTFSKLFSMAGLRLGYAIGHPEEIATIQKLCTPHNVNAIAELFALRLIENPTVIDDLIAKHQEGREYLKNKLEEHHYQYYGKEGNFIFIKPKSDAELVVDKMKQKKKILIKSYENVGEYGDCLRVTTGEKIYMEQFMNALVECDK